MKEDMFVIDRHLISLAMALQHVDDDVPALQAWGRTAAAKLAAGGRMFTCGAGSSAQQARHLATELASPEDERPSLAVEMLLAGSDARSECRPADVLLCISATEANREIAATAVAAGEAGTTTWALTGPAPNALAAACTEAVCVNAALPSTVEEVHLAAVHIIGAALDSAIRDAVRAGMPLPGQPRRDARSAIRADAHPADLRADQAQVVIRSDLGQ